MKFTLICIGILTALFLWSMQALRGAPEMSKMNQMLSPSMHFITHTAQDGSGLKPLSKDEVIKNFVHFIGSSGDPANQQLSSLNENRLSALNTEIENAIRFNSNPTENMRMFPDQSIQILQKLYGDYPGQENVESRIRIVQIVRLMPETKTKSEFLYQVLSEAVVSPHEFSGFSIPELAQYLVEKESNPQLRQEVSLWESLYQSQAQQSSVNRLPANTEVQEVGIE